MASASPCKSPGAPLSPGATIMRSDSKLWGKSQAGEGRDPQECREPQRRRQRAFSALLTSLPCLRHSLLPRVPPRGLRGFGWIRLTQQSSGTPVLTEIKFPHSALGECSFPSSPARKTSSRALGPGAQRPGTLRAAQGPAPRTNICILCIPSFEPET